MLFWLGLGIVLSVWMIGKPRTPMTPGQAVFGMVFGTLMCLGVVYLAQA